MVADEDPFEAARRGTLEEIGSAIPEGLDEIKLEMVKGEFEVVSARVGIIHFHILRCKL